MKRWHEEYHRTKRQWVEDCRRRLDWWGYGGLLETRQIGRFRKRKPYDCGNTQCYMCHSDKFPKRELTHQEFFSKLSLKEQMDELYGNS